MDIDNIITVRPRAMPVITITFTGLEKDVLPLCSLINLLDIKRLVFKLAQLGSKNNNLLLVWIRFAGLLFACKLPEIYICKKKHV